MIDFSQIDPVIHEKGRLSIVTLLAGRATPWAFQELRDELGMSDGNLITHLRSLEQAGYVTARKDPGPGRQRTRYHLTPAGTTAFDSYLNLLARIVALPKPGGKIPRKKN